MLIKSQASEWIRIIAKRLDDICEEVVFLGGAVVGLLITDSAVETVRLTKDVDVIVEVSSRVKYAHLQERLREKGFTEDTEDGAPICRWVIEGIKVDVMPTSGEILGFTNRWYASAMKSAQHFYLSDEASIRLVTAPYFMATKIEAFHSRGENDYQLSHDLEDAIAFVDGRPELVEEIRLADDVVRGYLRERIAAFLHMEVFLDALPGKLAGDSASQARLPRIVQRLQQIAAV